MDLPVTPQRALEPGKSKREQRFLRFKMRPGDEALLEQISGNQRVLLLSDGTYQDKAQRFGIPIGTVRSRIHRARAALEALRQDHQAGMADTTVN